MSHSPVEASLLFDTKSRWLSLTFGLIVTPVINFMLYLFNYTQMYQLIKGGKSGVSDLLAVLTPLIPIKTLIHHPIIYQSSNSSKLINGVLSLY